MGKRLAKPLVGLAIIITLVILATFVACEFLGGNNQNNDYPTGGTPRLSAPTGLRVDDYGILRWDSMDNVQFFLIVVDDDGLFFNAGGGTTSYDLSQRLADVGEYTIRIQAVALPASGYLNSEWTYIVHIVFAPVLPRLQVPDGLRFDSDAGTRIRWDSVEYSIRYIVRVTSITTTHTFETTELSEMLERVPHGQIEVKVKAVGDGIVFADSEYAVLTAIKLPSPTLRHLSSNQIELITFLASDATYYRIIIEWTGANSSGRRTYNISANDIVGGRLTFEIAEFNPNLTYIITAVALGDNLNFTSSNMSVVLTV
ncbi:MAG: hypothetical protein FWC80_02930 [Firmicutes bacterium]|nr:hypothetical protein [Bacillota bacterium]